MAHTPALVFHVCITSYHPFSGISAGWESGQGSAGPLLPRLLRWLSAAGVSSGGSGTEGPLPGASGCSCSTRSLDPRWLELAAPGGHLAAPDRGPEGGSSPGPAHALTEGITPGAGLGGDQPGLHKESRSEVDRAEGWPWRPGLMPAGSWPSAVSTPEGLGCD